MAKEMTIVEAAEALGLLAQCVPYLRTLTRYCEACQGAGEIIYEDDSAESCPHCQPIWALIERISPPPHPPVPPLIEEMDDDIAF